MGISTKPWVAALREPEINHTVINLYKWKIAETQLEKTNILNEQFTSVFTKEEKNNILEKGLSPFTPIRNITISDSGVRTPKREESKWTRQDAHHIVKTNSQHHNTSNIIYISTITGPGRNTNRLEKCEHSANL